MKKRNKKGFTSLQKREWIAPDGAKISLLGKTDAPEIVTRHNEMLKILDHVDQIAMWRIGDLTVDFRADGSIETQLVYTNGDERISGGTWQKSEDKVEIRIKGGGETEGDEPFERTREFTIDELTAGAFSVHAEIGPAEKPIVLTYKATRLPSPKE